MPGVVCHANGPFLVLCISSGPSLNRVCITSGVRRRRSRTVALCTSEPISSASRRLRHRRAVVDSRGTGFSAGRRLAELYLDDETLTIDWPALPAAAVVVEGPN